VNIKKKMQLRIVFNPTNIPSVIEERTMELRLVGTGQQTKFVG
jgi:hypothetical protein